VTVTQTLMLLTFFRLGPLRTSPRSPNIVTEIF